MTYIVRPDGIKLHLREWGAGECVCLLIHGFADGGFVWNGFANTLQPGFRLVAVDLRGHGDSDWDGRGEYRVATHCADVLHIIAALGLKRLMLLGHSLGASLAIRIAATLTDHVSGLVVVDYGPGIDSEVRQYVTSLFNDQLRTYASPAEYATVLATVRPLVDPRLRLELAVSALRPCAAGGFELKCDPALGRNNEREREDVGLEAQLHLIRCPALVVRGSGSAFVSRQRAHEMIKSIRHARLLDVPMSGHAVALDNPAGFLAAVEPFLLENRSACARQQLRIA